ncbi:MAG: hypothetical protein ACXIU7_05225 [Roseinatronobacter sp.]
MIVILGAAGGCWLGIRNATKAGGNRKDQAQYGIVGAIVGALLGLFLTIGVERMF